MRVVAVLGGVGIAALVVAGVVHGQRKTDPTLDKLASDFVTTFNAKDAAKIASLYADDAVLMLAGEPLLKGRSSIEAHYKEQFRVPFTKLQVKPMESVISGSSAFEAGTSSVTMPRASPGGNAAPRIDNGKYVVIYKRVGNAWKIAYDISNDDQPSR
jgi:uncharacterized protein (TIGR02246 family)